MGRYFLTPILPKSKSVPSFYSLKLHPNIVVWVFFPNNSKSFYNTFGHGFSIGCLGRKIKVRSKSDPESGLKSDLSDLKLDPKSDLSDLKLDLSDLESYLTGQNQPSQA